MKRIDLHDKIQGAYTNADGYTLFLMLKPFFQREERVEISMLGFPPMSSSFFNSSFGELIQNFGIDKFRTLLKFTNITKSQINQIKGYLDFHLH